jgi:fermentation-respiration switch protein FrsA (DUF1100 family)
MSETPMLFVVGDHDAVTPVDQVRAVARRYPRAEMLVVPGAGHLRAINVDKDTYTATVLDFLAQALKPVSAPQRRAGKPCTSSVPVRSSAPGS